LKNQKATAKYVICDTWAYIAAGLNTRFGSYCLPHAKKTKPAFLQALFSIPICIKTSSLSLKLWQKMVSYRKLRY